MNYQSIKMFISRLIAYWVNFLPERIKLWLKHSPPYRVLRKKFIDSIHDGAYQILSGPIAKFWIHTNASRVGYLSGFYELDITRAIVEQCKPGMIVCDIGAHHGYFTLLFSKIIGKSGHCYSFEAVSRNTEWIREAIHLNRLENVTCEHLAIGDHEGKITIKINPEQYSKSKFTDLVNVYEESQYPDAEIAPMVSLDGYFSKSDSLQCIDMIKIDVEGAEECVLQGAEEIIARNHPMIIIEIHSFHKKDTPGEKILEKLRHSGYILKELAIDQGFELNKHYLALPPDRF